MEAQVFFGLDAFTGEPITRTKASHPYSYQPFEVWRSDKEQGDSGVYSDRLYQWDSQKFNACCREVWGNEGQYFDDRSPEDIERFLQLYFDKPGIRLTRIVECCNQSSGYPLWYFNYRNQQ